MPEFLVEMVFPTPKKAAAPALHPATAATPASSKVTVATAGTVAQAATRVGIPESQVTAAMLVKRAPTPNVAVARVVAQGATAPAAQVATEFIRASTSPRQPKPLVRAEARRWIETWMAFPMTAVDGTLVLEAVQIAERFQIGMPPPNSLDTG